MTQGDALQPPSRLPQSAFAWLCVIGLLSGLALADRAPAQDTGAAPKIADIHAGFAGRFKVGYWAPLAVTIEGGDEAVRGRVEVTVLDGDAVPNRVTAPAGEVAIGPGDRVTVPLAVKIGQLASSVTIELRAGDGQSLASRHFSTTQDAALAGILPSMQQLVVTLGGPVSTGDMASFDELQTKIADVEDVSQLPTDWWGYEGIDAVILATGSEAVGAALAADVARVAALDQWVRMGGRLVLCVGRRGEQMLAADSALVKLAPGAFEAMVPLRQSTVFESYAETNEPLNVGGGPFAIQVPKLRDVQGRIEAYAGVKARDLPLVVRTTRGFGEIVFVAFDLESGPLADWVARPGLFDRLLRRAKIDASASASLGLGQVTTLGFVDLAGQLRGALDQFSGVVLVPFWLVALLVVAYIACIGPLDYWIVKRLLGRMEATWATFGVTVTLFSVGAAALAYALKGNEICVNQLDVVDVDAETGYVRGTLWANLFTPQTETYDLSLRPPLVGGQPTPAEVLFSWMGLSGTGFGGMDPDRKFGAVDSPAGSLPLFTEPYTFSEKLDRMRRVPIAVWSSKAFVGRWWQHGKIQIENDLADRGKLVGSLASHLDAPLEDAVLFYDRWAYRLRTLGPGQRIDVETGLDPQTVDTYLRHVTAQGDRNVALPYDRASFDVPRILEIMTTFELAGGQKYTGLTNNYQGFVDMSSLIKNGRAVLVGRSRTSATEMQRDGKSLSSDRGQHWTIYRYVFPVRDGSGS